MAGLVAFATAFAATRALRGRTFAEDRVRLEPKTPVEVKQPTIVVYAAHGRAHLNGRELLEATICRPRFELFLPSSVEASAGAANWTLDTDASAALAFACFWRQCEIALQADQSVWANLFRAIVLDITTVESASDLFETEKGAKIGARVVELTVDPINEPRIGVAPEGVWADFLAAMRTEGNEIASLADLVESQIVGGASLGDWQSDFAVLGLSQSYGPSLGLAPGGDVDNLVGEPDFDVPADPTTADPQV